MIYLNLICISAIATQIALLILFKYTTDVKISLIKIPRYMSIILGIMCIIGLPIILCGILLSELGRLLAWFKEDVTL